jgi:hypothetical protein|uniref:Uncharacterized protein n=1 Tax=Phaeodactylum tricornutum TaxID=2850 RepID=A0A8J9T624_PHATR
MSAFNLETFILHLACHLVGARAVRETLEQNSGSSRLYWRSPILCADKSVDPTRLDVGNESHVIFVDVAFEIVTSTRNAGDRIRCHWGSLVQHQGSGYYLASHFLSVADLERHFPEHVVSVSFTPGAALAQTMATALRSIQDETSTRVERNRTNGEPPVVWLSLDYEALDEKLDLCVYDKQNSSRLEGSSVDKLSPAVYSTMLFNLLPTFTATEPMDETQAQQIEALWRSNTRAQSITEDERDGFDNVGLNNSPRFSATPIAVPSSSTSSSTKFGRSATDDRASPAISPLAGNKRRKLGRGMGVPRRKAKKLQYLG